MRPRIVAVVVWVAMAAGCADGLFDDLLNGPEVGCDDLDWPDPVLRVQTDDGAPVTWQATGLGPQLRTQSLGNAQHARREAGDGKAPDVEVGDRVPPSNRRPDTVARDGSHPAHRFDRGAPPGR